MKMISLILFLTLFTSCSLFEPQEVIGVYKTADFAEDGFTCQTFAVQYAHSAKAAYDNKWRLQFGSTIVNDSGSTIVGILTKFVILDKTSGESVEFISIYHGRLFDIGEVREDVIVSKTVFTSKELSNTQWSARVVIIE